MIQFINIDNIRLEGTFGSQKKPLFSRFSMQFSAKVIK